MRMIRIEIGYEGDDGKDYGLRAFIDRKGFHGHGYSSSDIFEETPFLDDLSDQIHDHVDRLIRCMADNQKIRALHSDEAHQVLLAHIRRKADR